MSRGKNSRDRLVLDSPEVIENVEVLRHKVQQLKSELPHLYGWPWYKWAWDFYQSRNPVTLLCAANQVSKSSSLIRKNIEFACNKKMWAELWPRFPSPKQFWYFYPTAEVATSEFHKKWVPEFMPRDSMKTHEWYGWNAVFGRDRMIDAIHFRSGCSIYFKTYSQNVKNLQTSTVHMVSGDEEMPEEFVDELLQRLGAVDGYFNLVFTATEGLQLWYRAMECRGTPEETFPNAFKQTVSIYECKYYMDGSPSIWTPERIARREAMCTTEAEKQRRLHGRFVKDEGRRYSSFSPDINVRVPTEVEENWRYYAAVDVGSGGGTGPSKRSSAGITFIATNPEFTKGRVINSWRGDGVETTAQDILTMYRKMKGQLPITNCCYDYNSREFGLISARLGEPFIPADKATEAGEKTLNMLFQSGSLVIDDGVGDNAKLVTELMTIPAGKKNRAFQDDLSDSLRYCVMLIPWNYGMLEFNGQPMVKPEVRREDTDPLIARVPYIGWTNEQYMQWEMRYRRGLITDENSDSDIGRFYDEIDEWNEQYG